MTQDRIAETLGKMAGALEAVERRASEHGEKLDAVVQNQHQLITSEAARNAAIDAVLNSHGDRLDAVEEVTTSVNSLKAKWAGATIVLGLIGTVAGGAIALFWRKIGNAMGL